MSHSAFRLLYADDLEADDEQERDHDDVEERVALDPKPQELGAGEDGQGRQGVAAADEEGVDGRLGLVLLLPLGDQEQGRLGRVLQRVIRAVLQGLDPAHEDERGPEGDQGVAAQGEDRQEEKGASDPDPLEDPRDEQELDDEGDQVRQELVVHEGVVDGLALGPAGGAPRRGGLRLAPQRGPFGGGRFRLCRRDRLVDRHGGDDELPGRIDEIVEADHDGDEEEIAALEDQPEAAAGLERLLLDEGLLVRPGRGLPPLRPAPLDVAAVYRPGQDDAEEEQEPGDEHELELPAPAQGMSLSPSA